MLVDSLNELFQTYRFGWQSLLTGRNTVGLLDPKPAAI
jgi:hypothetical protein